MGLLMKRKSLSTLFLTLSGYFLCLWIAVSLGVILIVRYVEASVEEREVPIPAQGSQLRALVERETGVQLPQEAKVVRGWRVYSGGDFHVRTHGRVRFPSTRPPGRWLDEVARKNGMQPIDGSLDWRRTPPEENSKWVEYDAARGEFEVAAGS